MILPCPVDHTHFRKLPMTAMLVFTNVFVFILFFSGQISGKLSGSSMLRSDTLGMTGQIYWQYMQELSLEQQKEKPAWIQQMQAVDADQMQMLGTYALRDGEFLKKIETLAPIGDDIAIRQWKKDAVKFRDQYFQEKLYHFGLSTWQLGPASWLTYQFSHAGFFHLLSNMMFLVVMSAAVEMAFGSGMALFIYVVGGFAGGLGFLFTSSHGVIPMVGASASVSALLAFYCLAEERRRIRFLYFVSPMPGQYGSIYLPTLLIIPLFLLVDVSSLMATPEGLGSGVAYSAHLGGAAFGFAVAGLWRLKKYLTFKFSVLD
jgi:membrane associated rhomboid family serine protease